MLSIGYSNSFMKNCIASRRNNVCGENHNFDSDAIAGYVCSGGISDKVAHWDGITQEECNASNGLWLPVLCNDIHVLFDNANENEKETIGNFWAPHCCYSEVLKRKE
jgi:hypothetical protein